MKVDFSLIRVGSEWTRPSLASLWTYKSDQAFAKGAFCPRFDKNIILFVTRDKQAGSTPYRDSLEGSVLKWEGSTDHAVDARIVSATDNGARIHVFFRPRHHMPFTYFGVASLDSYALRADAPSAFKFRLMSVITNNTESNTSAGAA